MDKKYPLGKTRLPISWPFLVIIGIGLLLRLSLVLGRAFWTDEVFYVSIANFHSWGDILSDRYNLASDNPSFFFIFLQAWSFFGKSIFWLRLPGLISFVASAFLLLAIFKDTGWRVKLIVISLFSFSPFFIHLNFWISPYNLILLLSFLQLYVVIRFIQGAYDKKRKLFIISSTLVNLLLFNIHYSAVYTFFVYPVLLTYLWRKNKGRARTFLISVVVSAIFLLPSAVLLYQKWNVVDNLLKVNAVNISIPSVLYLLVYIFDKSILRVGLAWLALIPAVAVGILAFLALLSRPKSETNRLWFLFFLGLFVLPALFLFFFYQKFPSIFVERAFLTFHLGFYFLVAYILGFFKSQKGDFFAFCFFLAVLLASAVFARVNWLNDRFLLPGDVSRNALIKTVDYRRFLEGVSSELKKEGKWLIMFSGDETKNRYARSIFLGYYFLFSPELEEIRSQYGDRIDFLSTKIKRKESTLGYNILLINIGKEEVGESQLGPLEQKYGARPVVVDYWSYFPDLIDK